MSLIENLKNNFESVTVGAAPKPPQNLMELRRQLRLACEQRNVHGDLANYCYWYVGYLRNLHDRENATMGRTRGKARRMWAEQSLIYQDIIRLLDGLSLNLSSMSWPEMEEEVDSFYELVDELTLALGDMQEWSNSEEARCLSCGWNGPTGHCPHCKVQTLKPIRTFATNINHYVEPGEAQLRVFRELMGVLEGKRDLSTLKLPLLHLQKRFKDTADYLYERSFMPVAQKGFENIAQALLGIDQMMRTFEDADAQHLEDGWALIYQSDRSNLELVDNAPNSAVVAAAYDIIRDQVSLGTE